MFAKIDEVFKLYKSISDKGLIKIENNLNNHFNDNDKSGIKYIYYNHIEASPYVFNLYGYKMNHNVTTELFKKENTSCRW